MLERTHAWQGGYDTNDGQTVLADDAYELCRYLVTAAHHSQFEFAVSDTIARIEQYMESLGLSIAPEMRIQPQQIAEGLNPLCLFLTEGAFQIL